ncbi:MAG TPA: pepsin/retropepsin-like aspartic protease family protein, partial [Pyrinomonadaceae bacterium]|nr:pepsin/retropepsin-like aspartic protease family protein [Pyrinomonadaceae bacterium]
RGLIVDAWINNSGPFTVALDTGAGVSIITSTVVQRAGLQVQRSKVPLRGGLSSTPIKSKQEAPINTLAIGFADNRLAATVTAAVVDTLPGSIDGILDPTQIFGSLPYSVDFQKREVRVLEAKYLSSAKTRNVDATVVRWVSENGGHRPFVRLADGRLALIDTGSAFGLAISEQRAGNGPNSRVTRDLGGGSVQVREVAAQTVAIGSLVLRNIPTELLINSAPGTPVILGRRALNPFRVTFDRSSNLIAIESTDDKN